jgi:hypothetical protein
MGICICVFNYRFFWVPLICFWILLHKPRALLMCQRHFPHWVSHLSTKIASRDRSHNLQKNTSILICCLLTWYGISQCGHLAIEYPVSNLFTETDLLPFILKVDPKLLVSPMTELLPFLSVSCDIQPSVLYSWITRLTRVAAWEYFLYTCSKVLPPRTILWCY